MLNKRVAVMVGGTLTCALGIGFAMQNTGYVPPSVSLEQAPVAVASVLPAPEPAAPPAPATTPVAEAEIELSDITLTSARAPEVTLDQSAAAPFDPAVLPETPQDPQTPKLGCQAGVSATPVAGASVRIDVTAPCLSNERLTLHHSGLMFSAATDTMGYYSVTIPALSEHAVFIVDFASGTDMVTTARVPDLQDYDRVAVQWSGEAGFEIHAREFGAGYGDAGHVWSGSDTQAGGAIVRLGEPAGLNPLMAEVYSFPRAASTASGQIQLSVETEVTARNCGQDVAAQSLELREGGKLRTRDMVLSVPNCNAIGDFLVLNNLVEDLKIAAR